MCVIGTYKRQTIFAGQPLSRDISNRGMRSCLYQPALWILLRQQFLLFVVFGDLDTNEMWNAISL